MGLTLGVYFFLCGSIYDGIFLGKVNQTPVHSPINCYVEWTKIQWQKMQLKTCFAEKLKKM